MMLFVHIFLIFMIIGLNIVDYITTCIILKYDGDELNPFINFIIHKFGMMGVVIVKSILILFIILIASPVTLLMLNLAYLIICTSNLYQISRLLEEI